MKLTPKQTMHLDNVAASDNAYRAAKRGVMARARIVAQEELSGYLAALDLQVRYALDAGVPKTRLYQEGLHTRAPATLRESLARTSQQAEAPRAIAEVDPLAERYSFDAMDNLITVQLTGETLERAAFEQDLTVAQVLEHGLDTADASVMRRDDGSLWLKPFTALWLDKLETSHPAVAWLMEEKNETEALNWYMEVAIRITTTTRIRCGNSRNLWKKTAFSPFLPSIMRRSHSTTGVMTRKSSLTGRVQFRAVLPRTIRASLTTIRSITF